MHTGETPRVDVHQHLWPAPLIEALRRRSAAPMLRGWTLHTAGEAPFDVDPAHHDPARRAAFEADTGRALVSLSSPLGIEALAPSEARPLLDAWHAGACELPSPFAAWASVGDVEPDAAELKDLLGRGFVGLQLPASRLAHPGAIETVGAVLRVCEQANRPVLVHPGPAVPAPGAPAWWPAVVDYPAQLSAAWWAWQAAGRAMFPDLRICLVAGAGLAPAQHERFAARGGGRFVVDRDTFVDTSSYGRQGVDALIRALGIDVLVLGSDRPYAEPADLHLGEAARVAVCAANPHRLLEGGTP